jgi:hypothetical protein
MSSLHISALEILTGGIDKANLDKKHKDTINSKFVFGKVLK